MVAVMVLIIAIVFIPPLQDEVVIATNATNLDCNNPAISGVHKATCAVLDVGFFYFISIVIAVGLAFLVGNRKITGVLTSIMVFVVVIVLIEPLKDFIVIGRDATHLNCASTAITVGARMTCIFVDLWLFYFVAVALATAVTFAIAKKVLPKFGI